MSLSLCMVVKNEASFLGACLRSALPIADEAVVVDTGSTDGTPDVARSLGVRVYEEPWPGDLGAAHNLPLEHARGDWILVLDGDEVLDAESRRAIRGLCEHPDAEAYEFTFRNYVFRPEPNWRPCDPADPLARGAIGWIPSRAVRLFRNDPRYRHMGCVHQRVEASVRAAGGRIVRSGIQVHHYGMLRCDRDKSAFYVGLARRQVARSGDARSWLELGITLMHLEDLSGARRAFARARDLGVPADASFQLSRIAAGEDRHEEAIACLRHALSALDGDEGVGVHRADLLEELGRSLESVGRRDEAERAFREALALRPDSPVGLTELIGFLIEAGRTGEAGSLVDRLLRRFRGLDTTWTALGNLRLAEGDVAGACRAFETAVDIDTRSVTARFNLAVTYARDGRPEEAARALAAARDLRNGAALADLDPSLLGEPTTSSSASMPSTAERPLVVSVTDHLHSGTGRVLVDVVEALGSVYRHVVLARDRGGPSGMGLREDLESLGVEVRAVDWGTDLRRQLEELRPALVVHHWCGSVGAPSLDPHRVTDEPWICVGHAPRPMPGGHDAWVVLSDFHQQSQGHLPPGRVHHIPNCVDTARFSGTGRECDGPVTVAMLCRLDPEKFPRRLVHYLPPLEELNARLLIAGRGRRRWEIEPELEAAGLADVVRFVGPIPSREVPVFLSGVDIGLHLTETADETMSKAVLEMLSSGLPVVSQPRGSLPELVESGRNGFLSESEAEIRRHLGQLIRSRELRRRMGAQSRSVAERYDVRTFTRRWQTLVDTLTLATGGRNERPREENPAGERSEATDRARTTRFGVPRGVHG